MLIVICFFTLIASLLSGLLGILQSGGGFKAPECIPLFKGACVLMLVSVLTACLDKFGTLCSP